MLIKYATLTTHEVKMVWYILASFFFISVDWDKVEMDKNATKNSWMRSTSSYLDHWNKLRSIKDLLCGQKENFFLLDQQGKSQVGTSSHLAHTGNQSVDRICLILPACGFCHIIIMIKLCCRFKLINIPLRTLLSKIRYLHSHLWWTDLAITQYVTLTGNNIWNDYNLWISCPPVFRFILIVPAKIHAKLINLIFSKVENS